VHHFGSGFPKSHDVSKALDRKAGAVREVVGTWKPSGTAKPNKGKRGHSAGKTTAAIEDYEREESAELPITVPATDAAKRWAGWGTALKPASEDWWLVRRPLVGTVAENVEAFGTGAINVDGCRVPGEKPDTTRGSGGANGRYSPLGAQGLIVDDGRGRWPANVVLSHSADCGDECAIDCPVRVMGEQSGARHSGARRAGVRKGIGYQGVEQGDGGPAIDANTGTAARFFNSFDPSFIYAGKASSRERNAGCEKNTHPTVKSQALMRHLVRLVTPPGGTVLDPFAGSGSTLVAAVAEGMRAIGIEREPEFFSIAIARVRAAHGEASEAAE
jgi:site-specific DNA-methyltransferase (adenine-specific)